MKLSLIIPTFNRLDLLVEAIDSIRYNQSSIYEIVIADDGSTDGTHTWCRNLQDIGLSTSVVVTRSSENIGAQKARNRGCQIASGDVVMFMDSDDVLAKHGVDPLLLQLQENPNLDYVYGKVVKTNASLQPNAQMLPVGLPFSAQPIEIAGYHWHTMGAIYRKEFLQKVGPWNEHLTGSQDWEFQARVKIAGGAGRFINHTVGYWRDHPAERVGTKKFRLDYVESVIEACLSIHNKAEFAGKLDCHLERRLIKKLLLHTAALSVHGYSLERQSYLKKVLKVLHFDPAMKILIQTLLLLPVQVDHILWNAFAPKS